MGELSTVLYIRIHNLICAPSRKNYNFFQLLIFVVVVVVVVADVVVASAVFNFKVCLTLSHTVIVSSIHRVLLYSK